MASLTAHQKVSDSELTRERIKQIALNHFYAYYVRHDMTDMLENIGMNIQWIGSKDHYVAHNREEFESLLYRELKYIPRDCIMKVLRSDVTSMMHECYSVTGELELRLPYQANVYYAVLRFSMILMNQDGEYVIVSIHTSTAKESALIDDKNPTEEKLHHIAADIRKQDDYDTVTGLLRLDAFKVQVRERMQEQSENDLYAMICTDISNFEKVNNLYGLQKADELLADTAMMLTGESKDALLCCRSVADHFLVLVSYRSRAQLRKSLKLLCSRFDEKIGANYADAYPQLGIGVYLMDDKDESVEKMVEYANVARKSLRLQKKTRIAIYDAKVYKQMQRVGRIERSMKTAMENHEFHAYLQPKYNLENGKIVGAEALVRWIRADGTMVYPDEFIPIFEKNGFIVQLDFFILSEICHMLHRRIQEGKICVPISINQSRVLLQDKDYVSKVAGVLERHNIPAQYIELELTERIFRDDLTDLAEMMRKLRALGVRWSIDDFGTGYSSLNLLKELPVDIIKIDKSFLDETENSEASKIIIRKTVELTQELDKTVVCEGVETENQADYLRGIRCDIAQGYLYAKPMPMTEFERLLDKEMHG